MGQEFKLLYGDKFVGRVMTGETDFPGISGQIELNRDTLERQNEIRDYINFSIESSDKVLRDNKEYEDFIDKEEFKHQSIIDSLDWTLISNDGVTTKILVPVFFRGNGVNFRFQ